MTLADHWAFDVAKHLDRQSEFMKSLLPKQETKPVTDRIDQMTHEELKAATRELVRVTGRIGISDRQGIFDLQAALKPFQPTTLDKVRELLKAEGWMQVDRLSVGTKTVVINESCLSERWGPRS